MPMHNSGVLVSACHRLQGGSAAAREVIMSLNLVLHRCRGEIAYLICGLLATVG
jgi:hypothetical protein